MIIRYGILAETRFFDTFLHSEFVRKIIFNHFNVQEGTLKFLPIEPELHFSGKNDLLLQLPLAIELYNRLPDLDLIVVVVDSDNLSLTQQNTKIKKIIQEVNCFPLGRIVVGVAVRNVESWLLTDQRALIEVTGISCIRPYVNTDSISTSKEEFNSLYGEYKERVISIEEIPLKKEDFALEIAKKSNFLIMRKHSKSFNSFCRKLTMCYKLITV